MGETETVRQMNHRSVSGGNNFVRLFLFTFYILRFLSMLNEVKLII